MASELEKIRFKIAVLKEVLRREEEKLRKIDPKDKDEYWEQKSAVWDVEKEIREYKQKERDCLYSK